MRAEDVHRWAASWRAVEERSRYSGGAPLEPAAAWRQALSLFALVGRLIGWPVEPDDIRRREDALAVQAWQRLRAASRRRA
jgi:hypothetical protein